MALSFRLKVAGTDEFRGLSAVSTSYRFHGVVRFDGAAVTLEWGGVAEVQKVGPLSVRDDRLPLPVESLVVSLKDLLAVRLVGGWWRPRVELTAARLDALQIVPSEESGTVRLWIARRDVQAGRELAESIQRAIGDGHHGRLAAY